MHKNNIIYKDLKPENVLIDRKGYIKITDFGLSKENIIDNHSAKSLGGTPEYLAPEIFTGEEYGNSVDWWSLGCIIYEMLTGIPPFYCQDKEKLFENIVKSEPKYPRFLSPEVVDFIKQLLIKDPTQRLGCIENGIETMKKHPFFVGINWEDIYNKKVKPPFIPVSKVETESRCNESLYSSSLKDYRSEVSPNDSEAFIGYPYEINKKREEETGDDFANK